MPVLFLIVAIAAEIFATTALKYSNGFTVLWPSVLCVIGYIVCYVSFSRAIADNAMNLGIAYATWCGVGIIATTLISMFIFKEEISMMSIIGIILVAAGCVIANIGSGGH